MTDHCPPFANCFWTKCVVFSLSAVHHRPGTMLDAIHPVTIHFDSYTSVEMIKTVSIDCRNGFSAPISILTSPINAHFVVDIECSARTKSSHWAATL